jgi:hypothetical protein
MSQTAIAPQLETTDQRDLTDAQLVALIGRGENWALSEIYARYARPVFSIGLKTMHDRARMKSFNISLLKSSAVRGIIEWNEARYQRG